MENPTETKHRTIHIHYSPTCWVALNKDQTKFEDSSQSRSYLREKHPKLKLITGSEANKLMGLDDHGNRLYPDEAYEPKSAKNQNEPKERQTKLIEFLK